MIQHTRGQAMQARTVHRQQTCMDNTTQAAGCKTPCLPVHHGQCLCATVPGSSVGCVEVRTFQILLATACKVACKADVPYINKMLTSHVPKAQHFLAVTVIEPAQHDNPPHKNIRSTRASGWLPKACHAVELQDMSKGGCWLQLTVKRASAR
jgi:hypothetical protein